MSMMTALDSLPLGRFHLTILAIIGLSNTLGAATGTMSPFVLAALVREWQLTPTQVGVVGSVELLGMLAGGAIGGSLADRWGRKRLLAITFVLSCVGSALSATAWDYGVFLAFRFIVGVGNGGFVPVGITLLNEFYPMRYRGRLSSAIEIFYMTGVILTALLALIVIPRFGWRLAFLCAALPAFYVFVLDRYGLESPRYLLRLGARAELEKVRQTVQAKTGINISPQPEDRIIEPRPLSNSLIGSLRELFSSRYWRSTMSLWVTWVALIYAYYGIITFLPSLLAEKGAGLGGSYERIFFITMASIPGCLVVSVLTDRVGRKRVLVPYLILAGVSAYLFGAATSPVATLTFGALFFFFMMGCWAVMLGYTAELYPTRLRTTGVGFATSFGRVGGIAAPFVIAPLLQGWGGSYATAFSTFTLLFFIATAAIVLWARETVGRSLEEISA